MLQTALASIDPVAFDAAADAIARAPLSDRIYARTTPDRARAEAVAAGRFAPDVAAVDRQRQADDSIDHETPLSEVFEDQIACADLVLLTKADLADLRREQQPLVNDRAARHGGHVILLPVREIQAHDGVTGPATNHVQLALQRVRHQRVGKGREQFAHAAFGGYKQSGIGRENHKMMLDHYQQTKNLLVSYDINPLGFF